MTWILALNWSSTLWLNVVPLPRMKFEPYLKSVALIQDLKIGLNGMTSSMTGTDLKKSRLLMRLLNGARIMTSLFRTRPILKN